MNRIRLLVLDSLLIAITIGLKEILAFIPNVEVVTLLLIVFALNLSLGHSILIATVFCIVEAILYGINFYSIVYFIVWNFLVIVTYLFFRNKNEYYICALSFFFGLFFDVFFAINFFVIDFKLGISYLMNGLFFSLIHAISNAIISLCLFDITNKTFKELLKRYRFTNSSLC